MIHTRLVLCLNIFLFFCALPVLWTQKPATGTEQPCLTCKAGTRPLSKRLFFQSPCAAEFSPYVDARVSYALLELYSKPEAFQAPLMGSYFNFLCRLTKAHRNLAENYHRALSEVNRNGKLSETAYEGSRSILFKTAKGNYYKPYDRFRSDYARSIVDDDDWGGLGFIVVDILGDIWLSNHY